MVAHMMQVTIVIVPSSTSSYILHESSAPNQFVNDAFRSFMDLHALDVNAGYYVYCILT